MDENILLFFIIVLSIASIYIGLNIKDIKDILIIIILISTVLFMNIYLY